MKLLNTGSYKTGINEVKGLAKALETLLKPIQKHLKEHSYWNDCAIEHTEYLRRDGFIPHSHNCGGQQIYLVIPKCESYEFDFLEFGECDVCGTAECVNEAGEPIQCGYEGQECASESDGHLDAALRIWLKFEGFDDKGKMQFFLYAGGGNGDAPYFRTHAEVDLFESSFTAKNLTELKTKGRKHIQKLLKKLGAK